MSRNLTRTIIFFIVLIFFINGFSKSQVSRNLSNLAYVLALGIESGENAKLKITAQFAKDSAFSPTGGSSNSSDELVITSGESDSIFSGINLLNSYIGKELNLAHCDVIVFSEEFAQKGISEEIYGLMNNEEIRPSTNIVVSTCSAYEYLKNINPNLEKLPTKYYDTFTITSRLTGYISNITIGNFYNDLTSKAYHPTAILGGLNSTAKDESSENTSKDSVISPDKLTAGTSSVTGNRGSENIGMAVFNRDKYCGKLTALESVCHLLITDSLDSCVISVDNPSNNFEKLELQLSPSKETKISVDIKDNKPKISIKISTKADVLTVAPNDDYDSSENLEKISESAEKYMKEEINKYLNKVSKEYGTDIDKFGVKSLCRFATIDEWKNFNWLEKFKDAEFDVSVDIDVVSSLLITKS